MDTDTPLDYAQFQLSPQRTRCELFVSGRGRTEKIASGFLKPFITHLKVAEQQSAQSSIRLQVEKRGNGVGWFNKGTLERFVRFVSTPEVMELANTLDAEMSQLEGARRIYSQGMGDPLSSGYGKNEATTAASADTTKKELLKAIDVRLMAVKQDLTAACTRASSAGFTPDTVSDLLLFSDHFGAHRLNEACTKFLSLCQHRPDLVAKPEQKEFDDSTLRASSGSDMSIDEPGPEHYTGSKMQRPVADLVPVQHTKTVDQSEEKEKQPDPVELQQTGASTSATTSTGSRRLSVQDRINLFEKQASSSTTGVSSGGTKGAVTGSKPEHRRVPSNSSMEKSVLRRWSGASDMSIDLGSSVNSDTSDRKDNVTPAGTPTSEPRSVADTGFRPENVTSKPTLSEIEYPNTKPNPSEVSSQSRYCSDEKEHGLPKEVHSFVCAKENQNTAPVAQNKTSQQVNVGPAIVPACEPEQVIVKDIEVATVSVSSVMQRDREEVSSRPRETPSDNVKARNSQLNVVSIRKTNDSDKKLRVPTNHIRTVERKSGQAPSKVPPQQLVGMRAHESTNDLASEESELTSKTGERVTRQPMGNNELQMKAEELEKLFATHKLRVQNENTPSARRNPKPKDIQLVKETPPTKNFDFNTSALLKMVESPDGGAHSLPEELRGKSYEKYTVKREAKLKAEWRSKRHQKEACLKAMHDSLEKSQAEMQVRFSRSAPGRTRISRKMSFSSHSELQDKDQVKEFMVEDEDEDQSHSDNLSADGSSISADSKRHAPSKSLSYSTPRGPAAASVPKSRTTTANSASFNRRVPPENPLAQSVPNFSDLRKENTRPLVASVRGNNTCSQVTKNFARSKSITEETANSTPEDISRTQSMRKSMVSTITTSELKDISTFSDANNANFGFKPLKSSLSNSYEPYLYDLKGNGIIPQPVLFHDPIKDENEDFETASLEEENPNPNPSVDFQADSDTENPSLDDPGVESGPGPEHNFPQLAHLFPYQYQNETSDTDAFSESPMGSPGSWNSVQVRKKWGTAQAPTISGAHLSGRKDMTKGFKRLLKFGRKSRGGTDGVNDWVSAASTTSEGDDDIMEVGDVGPTFGGAPVEDFRRSNLGYSLAAYDGYSESDVFGEQVQTMRTSIPNVPASFKLRDEQLSGSALKVPRSFFSLSSFRSKGTESKLR